MATKNEHVDFLEAENKKLNTLLQRHQEMFSSNYSYSSAVDALRKQADEKSQEAQECQKNFESAKSQLEAALSMCQAELQQARSFAQAQVAGLHMKIDSLQHDHSLSVELKDQHVASLRKEVQLLKKEHDNFKIQGSTMCCSLIIGPLTEIIMQSTKDSIFRHKSWRRRQERCNS